MPYFKVLSRDWNGRLCSLMREDLPPKLIVTYTPGVWAEAPVGKLFIAATVKEAREWGNPDPSIWIAEAEGVSEIKHIPSLYDPGFHYEAAVSWWAGEVVFTPVSYDTYLVADRVRLIREVL